MSKWTVVAWKDYEIKQDLNQCVQVKRHALFRSTDNWGIEGKGTVEVENEQEAGYS